MNESFPFHSVLLGQEALPDPPPIPITWSHDGLGLFCKIDVQMERRLPVPVFFRLGGEVRQVDAWGG